MGRNLTGYPELSFHGTTPWELDRNASTLTFAYLYAEAGDTQERTDDCFIYIMVNAHWEEHIFKLPIIPEGYAWHLAAESGGRSFAPGKEVHFECVGDWVLKPRSTAILVARM